MSISKLSKLEQDFPNYQYTDSFDVIIEDLDDNIGILDLAEVFTKPDSKWFEMLFEFLFTLFKSLPVPRAVFDLVVFDLVVFLLVERPRFQVLLRRVVFDRFVVEDESVKRIPLRFPWLFSGVLPAQPVTAIIQATVPAVNIFFQFIFYLLTRRPRSFRPALCHGSV